VAQTFFVDDELHAKLVLDAIVTVVDAKHLMQQLENAREAKEQIAFADVVLLNKTDLVSPEELDKLEARIKSMNAATKIYRTERSRTDLDRILDVGGFDLERILEMEPHFLEQERSSPQAGTPAGHDHHHHDHEHDDEVKSVGITTPGDLDADKLNEWLRELLMTQGPDIFRMKGILSIKDDPRRYVFQGVHMQMECAADQPWGDRPRQNVLLFIGRKLDRAKLNEGFQACLV
jgi:G3E family GTPase